MGAGEEARAAPRDYTLCVRLSDFVVIEFARAWQEERRAAVVDPEVVRATVADPAWGEAADDAARLRRYAETLLTLRVDDGEGVEAVERLRAGLTLARVAAFFVGVLAGLAMLEVTLPPNEASPVNLLVVVGEGIVLPTAAGLVTMALSVGAGRGLARVHWLSWLAGHVRIGALKTSVGGLAERVLRRSRVGGPLLASASHLLWIGCLATLLVSASASFVVQDYVFSWSSTVPIGADGVRGMFTVLAAPVQWLPQVDPPTAEQVTVSQWASLEGEWTASTGDAALDLRLRKAWYALALAIVAFWGLLPRLLGLLVAGWQVRRGVRTALESSSHRAVLGALAVEADAGTVTRRGSGDGEPDLLPPPGVAAGSARPGQGLDVIAFVTEPPTAETLARLRIDRLGLSGAVRLVGDDDDEAAIAAALEPLADRSRAPGGAVVVFDLGATPGRVREAFLRDVVTALGPDAPVHVLLGGAARFRSGPRGRAFDQRAGAWSVMAERCGVDGARVRTDEEGEP